MRFVFLFVISEWSENQQLSVDVDFLGSSETDTQLLLSGLLGATGAHPYLQESYSDVFCYLIIWICFYTQEVSCWVVSVKKMMTLKETVFQVLVRFCGD